MVVLFSTIFSAIWLVFKFTWFIWVGAGILILIKLALEVWLPNRETRKQTRLTEGWLSDRQLVWMLRGMAPDEFEEYVASLFEKMGYKTKVVGGPHDEGIDVVAEKDEVIHYIQCKKYLGSEVGVAAVRDFYGAIADRLARGKGYFITTNKFTLDAERFAEDKPIELVDSFKLLGFIRSVEKPAKIKQ